MMNVNGLEGELAPEFGTLEHLLNWARSRDPEETYVYMDTEDCALARYAKAHDKEYIVWDPNVKDNWNSLKYESAAGFYSSNSTMGRFVRELEKLL